LRGVNEQRGEAMHALDRFLITIGGLAISAAFIVGAYQYGRADALGAAFTPPTWLWAALLVGAVCYAVGLFAERAGRRMRAGR